MRVGGGAVKRGESVPVGVMPRRLWDEAFPDPYLVVALERYRAVDAAVTRYRSAGLPPDPVWLAELLGPMAPEG
jgi:hypothetical protein